MKTWAEMNKDQKKKIILVGLMSIFTLYAVHVFVLSPFFRNWNQAKSELDHLKIQLHLASIAMNGEAKVRTDIEQISKELLEASAAHIPPIQNPLSWVTEQIYRNAREVGVDINSVSEATSGNVPWVHGDESSRAFVPYTVRIVTECGYMDLLRLIKSIEASNPFTSIVAISITARDRSPEAHRIDVTLEWPIWIGAQGHDTIRKRKVETHG